MTGWKPVRTHPHIPTQSSLTCAPITNDNNVLGPFRTSSCWPRRDTHHRRCWSPAAVPSISRWQCGPVESLVERGHLHANTQHPDSPSEKISCSLSFGRASFHTLVKCSTNWSACLGFPDIQWMRLRMSKGTYGSYWRLVVLCNDSLPFFWIFICASLFQNRDFTVIILEEPYF